MKQKHLLMIVPFFPPLSGGGVFRPLSYVKYIGRHGWRTTVISPAATSYWVKDDSLLDEIPESCRVVRTPSLSGQAILAALRKSGGGRQNSQVRSTRGFSLLRKFGNGILFPDTYVGWYPFAVRAGRRILKDDPPDAIFSTSPPESSHLAGLKLHRISNLPWLADFRDPWINLYRFAPPTRLHRRRHEKLQAKICRRAGVVVASRWNLELLSSRHPGVRIQHISNGYDAEKLTGLFDLAPDPAQFQIMHAGMLSENRSAVPFLKGLRQFIDRTPGSQEKCRVVFLGPREDENEITARSLGLESVVEFRDSVSHRETLKTERTSHILLLINPYREIVLGKLYEYIGVCRPVLGLLPEGEGTELIASLNRGESAPPDEPELIAAKLGVLFGKYSEGNLDSSYNLEPVPQFSRENLAAELAGFLDSLITEGNR
jgi:glycosyltransferase involved in cell wall biosynthesis